MSSEEKKFLIKYFLFNIFYFYLLTIIPPFPPFYEDDFGRISIIGGILALSFYIGVSNLIFCYIIFPRGLEKNYKFIFFQFLNIILIHFLCVEFLMYDAELAKYGTRATVFDLINDMKVVLFLAFIYFVGFLIVYLIKTNNKK